MQVVSVCTVVHVYIHTWVGWHNSISLHMPSPHLLDWEAASCGMWASVKEHSYSPHHVYTWHTKWLNVRSYVCALYVLLLLLILSTQQTKIVYLLLCLWDGAHGLEATYIHTRQQHTHKQPEHDADKRPPRHTYNVYVYVCCMYRHNATS